MGRVADRTRIQIPISIRAGDAVASGVIHDISASGARIEEAELTPSVGTRLMLHAFLEDRESRLWILAEVVRESRRGGFAVRFDEMDAATAQLLMRLEGARASLSERPRPAQTSSSASRDGIKAFFQAETQRGDARVVGVTLDGLFISCGCPPERGEAVMLRIEAADEGQLELSGVSCWKRGLNGSGQKGFTMRLDTTSDEYLAFYSQFLGD